MRADLGMDVAGCATKTAQVTSVPVRLAGWGMAAGAAFAAVALLWPAPARDRMRAAAITACRALAARLRSEVTYLMGAEDKQFALDHDRAVKQANEAVSALRRAFLATPYRPTGLSTGARAIVRLVDEVTWLDAIVVESGQRADAAVLGRAACSVKLAAVVIGPARAAAGQELADPLARLLPRRLRRVLV